VKVEKSTAIENLPKNAIVDVINEVMGYAIQIVSEEHEKYLETQK